MNQTVLNNGNRMTSSESVALLSDAGAEDLKDGKNYGSTSRAASEAPSTSTAAPKRPQTIDVPNVNAPASAESELTAKTKEKAETTSIEKDAANLIVVSPGGDAEVFSPMSESDDSKSPSFFSTSVIPISPKQTLLEKAQAYRIENPEAWQQKCKEKEKILDELYGRQAPNPFLESYYQAIDERIQENKRKAELGKLELPKIVIQIVFNLPREQDDKTNRPELYKTLHRNLCIFDHDDSLLDVFRSDKNDTRGSEPELIVTVKKGKYLQNPVKKGHKRFKTAQLKCSWHGENGKRKQKHKTDYIFVSREGKSRWSYVYVLKGFDQEKLRHHSLTFKVSAKTEDHTDVLGELVLGGDKAKVVKVGQFSRGLSEDETELWQKAIANPGKEFDAVIDLDPCKLLSKDQEKNESNETKNDQNQTETLKNENNNLKTQKFFSGIRKSSFRKKSDKKSAKTSDKNSSQEESEESPKKKPDQNSGLLMKLSKKNSKNSDPDSKAQVTSDVANKLPPSSRMKVTPVIEINKPETDSKRPS